ncbi:MAG: winged helix-turn-helix domain-containing protein [Candidatus Bathyarchaeota archaeon]|jgi:predicted transcriptional regulator|nr:winged helix-turn-helix domain-containing protein [Candidatus Bathyarchaeota archaeon]
MKRRTRYDIYMDTLETIRRKGVSAITRISYGANLPVDRAKEVVSFLTRRGLVKEEDYDGTRGYRITARGGQFLQALQTVKMYIEAERGEE